MTDIEGKKKVEYNAERKAETDRDLKYLVDKIKTDARAVGNKVKDPDTDLGTKYEKEKSKERENLAGLTLLTFLLILTFLH